jgi:hypothetical protein
LEMKYNGMQKSHTSISMIPLSLLAKPSPCIYPRR